WSCNAKANVPYETLRVLKDHGLRLLLVGYESGNQRILNNVKKGVRLDVARQFTRHAKALGIRIHGTFVLGLPGETHETIVETFYRRFYFRPRKLFAIAGEMARDRRVLARRLREGAEFVRFLAARRAGASAS